MKQEQWEVAQRVTWEVYDIMKQSTDKIEKSYLAQFYKNLVQIFWKSEYLLFHGYAFYNNSLLFKKARKNMSDKELQDQANECVMAAISIPLNHGMNNFSKLGVNSFGYSGVYQNEEDSTYQEFLRMAQMLTVNGIPSRKSLLQELASKRMLDLISSDVQSIYACSEGSSSNPISLAKQAKACIEQLKGSPALAKYLPYIRKVLTVRVLQCFSRYYRVMRLDSLVKHVSTFVNSAQLEQILLECNQAHLLRVKIDLTKGKETVSFEIASDTVEGQLAVFTGNLRQVVEKMTSEDVISGIEEKRKRIFGKVLEKINDEVQEIEAKKKALEEKKKQPVNDEDARKKREQQAKQQKIHNEQVKKDEKRLELERIQQNIAEVKRKEVKATLAELRRKGVKKVGSRAIEQVNEEDVDYDELMAVKNAIEKKEIDALNAELVKNQRHLDYMTRAQRELEKPLREEKQKDQGLSSLLGQLQDKHQQDLKLKQVLGGASKLKTKYVNGIMESRVRRFEDEKKQYQKSYVETMKQEILTAARAELRKKQQKEIQDKRKKEQDRKDREMLEKQRKGLPTGIKTKAPQDGDDEVEIDAGGDDDVDDWGRGTQKAAAAPSRGNAVRKPRDEEPDTGFKREIKKPEEDKKEAAGGPKRFMNTKKKEDGEDTGFARGGTKAEERKPAGGPPTFSRGGTGKPSARNEDSEFSRPSAGRGRGGGDRGGDRGGDFGRSGAGEKPSFGNSGRGRGGASSGRGGAANKPPPKKEDDDGWTFGGGSKRK